MKKIITLILIIVSLNCFSQGNSVKQDTAAQRKQTEEINKFIADLFLKTSLTDFTTWIYENNQGVKDIDAFVRMYTNYWKQKYLASKAKK